MVLDWYLGDSGSVTSPAIDSPTPLVSHSHLVPHLQNKSLMPQLFCPQPVHSPAAGTGTSSPPWTTAVCLATQRRGLSFHWTANEKKSIHVPTLILYYFKMPFFPCVFQHQLPSAPFSLENAVRGSLEVELGSCRVPSMKRRLKHLLGFGKRCGSGFTRCTRQAHIVAPPTATSTWGAARLGWPPLEGPGRETHRHCSCFRMSPSACLLFFKGTA